MVRIDEYGDHIINAQRVRQAVRLAGYRPEFVADYAERYRFSDRDWRDHAKFYVKTHSSVRDAPPVLVIHPFQLDEIMAVIAPLKDVTLCKGERHFSYTKFPYSAPAAKGRSAHRGYSVIFGSQTAVGKFLKAMSVALKNGKLTAYTEVGQSHDAVFMRSE